MATSKKPKTTAKKAVTKAASAKKPATKPTAKAVKKSPVKATAKVTKPAKTKTLTAEARPTPQLHSIPQPKRSNPPTPKWAEDALAYAQANPAVTLVSIIAAIVGILLILD